MKAKVKCGILACAICVVLGATLCLVTISRLGDKRTARKEGPGQAVESTKARLTRERLRQAVRNAKGGDRNELDAAIESVGRGRYVEVTEELLPDFVSFLQDEDPQVQLLGAQSLYALKSPKSIEALSTYLQGKDFARLEEMVSAGDMDERHYGWEIYASVLAIMALGDIGDKSVIPLLESLKGNKDLKLEFEGGPVERALAKLGALSSLLDVPPGADDQRIWQAARAIKQVKDPAKAPELMATVYNGDCATSVRSAALRALGQIDSTGVPEFLLSVIDDSQIPVSLQATAAIAAAQTGNEMFEEKLLEIAGSDSEIRVEGMYGLAILNPDEYMRDVFEKIRDENEPDEFRRVVLGRMYYVPRQVLANQKDELYACLDANMSDGSPHDEIRVRTWSMINRLFGEEPTLVLSSKSAEVTRDMRHGIGKKITMDNPHLRYAQREEKIDEKIDTIVQIYRPSSEKKDE